MGHRQREGDLAHLLQGEDGGVKSQMLDEINILESNLIGRAPSRTRGAAFQKTFQAKSGSATTKTRLSSLICLLLCLPRPKKKAVCWLSTMAPEVLALCTCRHKGRRVCLCECLFSRLVSQVWFACSPEKNSGVWLRWRVHCHAPLNSRHGAVLQRERSRFQSLLSVHLHFTPHWMIRSIN